MRKTILSVIGIVSVFAASAQLSLGLAGNYTMYKGNFQHSTAGGHFRVGYDLGDKLAANIGFTYGAPLSVPSMITLQGSGGTKTINSEIKYKFKTFNLMTNYTFAGDAETMGKLYGIAGIGLVLVSYDETPKETYDHNAFSATDQINGKDKGFTLNVGLGGQYRLGAPAVFAEAGVAIPANQMNGQYIENPIPLHFQFNIGIKLDLGGQQ